jgi:hypothetical protein
MTIDLIPADLRKRYRFDEPGHATAILASDFSQEFAEILGSLGAFHLTEKDILTPGGGRSPIPIAIDGFLGQKAGEPNRSTSKLRLTGIHS